MPAPQADRLLQHLLKAVPWEVHRIRFFGREVDSPRLSCWMGDADARYRYSGVQFEPHPWLPELLPLCGELEEATAGRFNSVLLNRYRDGRDNMGWHSDNEPELGPEPVIAMVSLGETRFVLRERANYRSKVKLRLAHGHLLVMAGQTQRLYQHSLPKTTKPVGERISLTFRWVRQVAPVSE